MRHALRRFAISMTGATVLGACTAPVAVGPPAANTMGPQPPTSHCLVQTGTRIDNPATGCVANVRSYTGNDVAQTGAVTAGRALQLLDPAVTVNH